MGKLIIGVAGAGIAGLTFAAAAAVAGTAAEVVVFERQGEIRDTGAGISLWPNALAALDSVGLGDAVRSAGAAVASGGALRGDGRPAVTFSGRSFRAALGDALVCVHRGELVALLAERLPPGTVTTGATVVGYERTGPRVRVDLADGGTAEVDALVGADGIGSAVAGALDGGLRFSYSGYTAWRGVADVPTPGDPMWAWLRDGHEVGWMPLPGGRTYWFATACLPEGHTPPGGDAAYLRSTFGHLPAPVPDLMAATGEDARVRSDITDRTPLSRWTDGPVTVVGDAAHPMRPHLGQGGCQAIEDAAVLARCLDAGADPAAAFARYEAARRRRAATIVALSRRSGFTFPSGRRTALFDRFTSLLPGVPIGAALRAVAPIAGYRAGLRAVRVPEARARRTAPA